MFGLLVWDVQARAWVPELLCEAKINHIDELCIISCSHYEVCGLDVSMDEVPGMDVFDAGNLNMRHVSK